MEWSADVTLLFSCNVLERNPNFF